MKRLKMIEATFSYLFFPTHSHFELCVGGLIFRFFFPFLSLISVKVTILF